MNFEAAYLAALAALIVSLGGVVPTAPALSFRDSELAHLRAIVLAVDGTLPGVQLNYHDLVLANWRAAIVARGGTVPGVQLNFRLSHLLHVQAFQLALGNSVGFSGNYHEALLQLVRSGLNFSALTALPSGRQSAVTTAANTAAATLSVTPQSIIDALSVGRGLCSMLPGDGCLLASTGGAVTVQGDPVGAIRSWTGVELATQSNASLQPTSAAGGLYGDGSKLMLLGGLSVGSMEAVCVLDAELSNGRGFWQTGGGGFSWTPFGDNRVYEHFGTSTRINSGVISNSTDKSIYQPRLDGSTLTLLWNGAQIASQDGLTPFLVAPSSRTLFSNGLEFYIGILSAMAFNLAVYNTGQRAAVREFCRNYYGVTY